MTPAATERVDSPLQSTTSPPPAPSRPPRLRLRPLSGWEEEHIERHQADPNTARLCNDVLARCLVPPGDDAGEARGTVEALLVAERDRELVALRRLSLGPDVTARIVCPACGETSDAEFSLDVLDVDVAPSPDRVTVDVPDLGEATFRLPTAGDQEELFDAELETEAQRVSWLLARCLERVGERTAGIDAEYVHGLPVRARRALDAALQDAVPALDLEMTVECSHCHAPVAAPFDVASFFFSS
jgi:hypothetical protein